MPKGSSEAVNRSSTDNTMSNRAKGQTMIYKALHRRLKIEHTNPT